MSRINLEAPIEVYLVSKSRMLFAGSLLAAACSLMSEVFGRENGKLLVMKFLEEGLCAVSSFCSSCDLQHELADSTSGGSFMFILMCS